ncbi:unnamed protein product [Gadus morhua 'NCC']
MHISTDKDSFLLFYTVAKFYARYSRGLIKGLSIPKSRARFLGQSIPGYCSYLSYNLFSSYPLPSPDFVPSSPNDYAIMLNSIFSDSLAHWKSLFVSFTNSVPWYTPELRTMKQTTNLNDFTNEPASPFTLKPTNVTSPPTATLSKLLNPPTSPPSSTALTGTPASCSPRQQTPPSAGHQSTHLT